MERGPTGAGTAADMGIFIGDTTSGSVDGASGSSPQKWGSRNTIEG